METLAQQVLLSELRLKLNLSTNEWLLANGHNGLQLHQQEVQDEKKKKKHTRVQLNLTSCSTNGIRLGWLARAGVNEIATLRNLVPLIS